MKSILIISPKFFNYERYLTEELSNIKYHPTFLNERMNSFFDNAIIRLGFKFLIKRKKLKRIKKFISKTDHSFDDILFISPEATNKNEIELMKQHFPNSRFILYMWDSLKNKRSKHLISYFDKCITFDYNDFLKLKNFEFLPLYFNPSHYKRLDLPKVFDMCICGSLHSDRYQTLLKLQSIAKKNNLKLFRHIYVKNNWLLLYFRFKLLFKSFTWIKKDDITFKSLSPDELNKIYNQSRAVVDIHHPLQNGLTNRTFEVLATTSKLITTNSTIEKYDFFNSKQIEILNRKEVSVNLAFLNEQSIVINLDNYTLESWIRTILK